MIRFNPVPAKRLQPVWPGSMYIRLFRNMQEKWRCAKHLHMVQSYGKECEECAFLVWIRV